MSRNLARLFCGKVAAPVRIRLEYARIAMQASDQGGRMRIVKSKIFLPWLPGRAHHIPASPIKAILIRISLNESFSPVIMDQLTRI